MGELRTRTSRSRHQRDGRATRKEVLRDNLEESPLEGSGQVETIGKSSEGLPPEEEGLTTMEEELCTVMLYKSVCSIVERGSQAQLLELTRTRQLKSDCCREHRAVEVGTSN